MPSRESLIKDFDFNLARKMISKARKIVVTSHHNPDGDAIGSSLAIYQYLNKIGKRVKVIVPNEYPGFLKWLPGNEEIIIYNRKKKTGDRLLYEADLIFCLDYNSIHRTGEMTEVMKASKAGKIMIDHHLDPVTEEFDMHFSTIGISSTAELVYLFIQGTDPSNRLIRDTAEALFVGIMTDTGSFSYACNDAGTFEVTADLIRAGINPERIHRLVYDTYSEDRLRLLGFCIFEKLTIVSELSLAYVALSKKDLKRFNYKVGDTEGVVNYALSVDGVKMAVLLTERSDRIRLSFRSKGNLSVNAIARNHFNGGGHMNAAGGDAFASLDDAVKLLISVLSQYKEQIDRSNI